MSRSYKHTPIAGISLADSEAKDKALASRRWRRAVRQALRCGNEDLPAQREISDVWGFDKDGKRWFGEGSSVFRGRMFRGLDIAAWRKGLMRK